MNNNNTKKQQQNFQVYGNHRLDSDFDYKIVMNVDFEVDSQDVEAREAIFDDERDYDFNFCFFSAHKFELLYLENHIDILVAVSSCSALIPSSHQLSSGAAMTESKLFLKDIKGFATPPFFQRNLDFRKLRRSCVRESDRCWKKATIMQTIDQQVARKNIGHSLRILLFGLQLFHQYQISDFACANYVSVQIAQRAHRCHEETVQFFKEQFAELTNRLCNFYDSAVKQFLNLPKASLPSEALQGQQVAALNSFSNIFHLPKKLLGMQVYPVPKQSNQFVLWHGSLSPIEESNFAFLMHGAIFQQANSSTSQCGPQISISNSQSATPMYTDIVCEYSLRSAGVPTLVDYSLREFWKRKQFPEKPSLVAYKSREATYCLLVYSKEAKQWVVICQPVLENLSQHIHSSGLSFGTVNNTRTTDKIVNNNEEINNNNAHKETINNYKETINNNEEINNNNAYKETINNSNNNHKGTFDPVNSVHKKGANKSLYDQQQEELSSKFLALFNTLGYSYPQRDKDQSNVYIFELSCKGTSLIHTHDTDRLLFFGLSKGEKFFFHSHKKAQKHASWNHWKSEPEHDFKFNSLADIFQWVKRQDFMETKGLLIDNPKSGVKIPVYHPGWVVMVKLLWFDRVDSLSCPKDQNSLAMVSDLMIQLIQCNSHHNPFEDPRLQGFNVLYSQVWTQFHEHYESLLSQMQTAYEKEGFATLRPEEALQRAKKYPFSKLLMYWSRNSRFELRSFLAQADFKTFREYFKDAPFLVK